MSTAYVQADAIPGARVQANEISAANMEIVRTATIALTANVVAADTYKLFFLPKGAIVVGGYVNGTRIDTNASATLALSLGFAAGAVASAAPTALLASAVSANSATVGANVRAVAPTSFTPLTETLAVMLTFDAVAATFAAGTVSVTVRYITPGSATS